jgi:hypothetical protein
MTVCKGMKKMRLGAGSGLADRGGHAVYNITASFITDWRLLSFKMIIF